MAARVCASGSENAMMGRITPFTLAELISMLGKSENRSVPIMKPMMMVTITAVAPASVGVKRPEKMPTKMIPGTRKAYQPWRTATPSCISHSRKLIWLPLS